MAMRWRAEHPWAVIAAVMLAACGLGVSPASAQGRGDGVTLSIGGPMLDPPGGGGGIGGAESDGTPQGDQAVRDFKGGFLPFAIRLDHAAKAPIAPMDFMSGSPEVGTMWTAPGDRAGSAGAGSGRDALAARSLVADAGSLTMQEDIPRLTFEACVRSKLNGGRSIESAFGDCQAANPGYAAPAIPRETPLVSVSTGHASPDASAPQMAPIASEPLPSLAASLADAALPGRAGAGAAAYAGSECDVSRDPAVLLSQDCLRQDDAMLVGKMSVAAGGALHVPIQDQPGHDPSQHALLATPHAAPHRDQDAVYAAAAIPSPLRRGNDAGSVRCDWAIGGDEVTGLSYGRWNAPNVRSCLKHALHATDISSGTISITLSDIGHGIARTMVECHRRNGQDVCGIIH